jgi:hypothetical protein
MKRKTERKPWSMYLFIVVAFGPMYIVPKCNSNQFETYKEWEEYNKVFHRSSYSPLHGAAIDSSLHAAPTSSGAPPTAAESVHLEKGDAAPESQIIVPALSRSPVMDRLIPQKAQSRSLATVRDLQIENARKVERLLWDKGYRQPHLVIAILANGWHESRWNAGTIYKEKNGTVSRGFFQLTNGALTIEGNVEQLTTKAPYAARIKKWYSDAKREKWSAGEAAYWFARRVEICASRYWNERKVTADKWWSLMEAN